MEQTICRMKSPFGGGYVEMPVPARLSISDLRTAAGMAAEFASALCGSDTAATATRAWTECLLSIPVNTVGRTALDLVAYTIPDRIADGPEGDILVGAMAAHTFVRQLLDRIASGTPMDREMYERSIVAFCSVSNPRFVEAVKLRLPALAEQAKRALPADADRTKRFIRVCKATMAFFGKLPERMGEEAYARWVSGVTEPKVTAAVAAAETASAKASASAAAADPAPKRVPEEAAPVPTPIPVPVIEEKKEKEKRKRKKKEEKLKSEPEPKDKTDARIETAQPTTVSDADISAMTTRLPEKQTQKKKEIEEKGEEEADTESEDASDTDELAAEIEAEDGSGTEEEEEEDELMTSSSSDESTAGSADAAEAADAARPASGGSSDSDGTESEEDDYDDVEYDV